MLRCHLDEKPLTTLFPWECESGDALFTPAKEKGIRLVLFDIKNHDTYHNAYPHSREKHFTVERGMQTNDLTATGAPPLLDNSAW